MQHQLKRNRLAVALALAGLGMSSAHAADTGEEATLAQVEVQSDKDDFDARRESSSTKLVYGREELDRMNELTVGDYLRRLPGVTFTGPPGNPKDIRMRGMDKGYTQILIDGEAVPGGGKERQIQVDRLPLDMVERIEVIRAPTADMPNEGLMGTINIVLRQAPNQRIANARLVGGVVDGEEHNMRSGNLSGQYGDSTGNVRYLLNASIGSRGDVKTKDKSEQSFNANTGVRTAWTEAFEDETTRTKSVDFSPRINIKLSDVSELVLTPFLSRTDDHKLKDTFNFKYNTPLTGTNYIANGTKREVEDKLREISRFRGEWKRKLEGGEFSLYGAVQSGGEEKDKVNREWNANGSFKSHSVEDAEQDESEVFAGVRFNHKFGMHGVGMGMEYGDKSREDEKVTTAFNSSGVATSTSGGRGDNYEIDERRIVAYIQDEIGLTANHMITPGLRLQRIDREAVDGAGERFDSRYDLASPSLHYLWKVDGRNNLRASVTETVKPPKFDDLSPVTETKAGTTSDPDKSGNPDLNPEKAVGFELGWEHYLPRAGGVLGANFFRRNIEDKIESRTDLEGARYVSRPFNVGDAKVWGWELDARPRMDFIGLPELMLRFNYTRMYSELKDTATGLTTRIKDQPPYVYNIGFDWQLPRWNAAFGLNYNFTPRFIKNPTETTKLDPEAEQKLLDMYFMKRLNKDFALRVTASNLLDMSKDKDKYEYSATTGNVTKNTVESESGGRTLLFALEGKW